MINLAKLFALALIAAAAVAAPAIVRADGDVPRGDPSYAQVQDLGNKGFIGGYAAGQDLFQGRTVNRYEMAALVKRAYDNIKLIQNGTGPEPSAAAQPSAADISELNALVAQFAVELDIMGAHISTPVSQTASAAAPSTPYVRPGITGGPHPASSRASLQISTLFQEWYLAGSRDVTNFGSGPGVGTGLTSPVASDSTLADTFKIRRAQVRFTGNVSTKTYYDVMFDLSKDQNISISTTPSTISTASTSPLQDLVLGYHLSKTLDAEVGQQKVPLSIEGYRSNANLLTAERSLMNSVPVANGRVGDIRDLGVMLRYNPSSKFRGIAAVMDDAGNTQNLPDNNNSKELILNGQLLPVRGLQIGSYGEISGGTGSNYEQRRRIGGDLDYVFGKTELTGEYEEGYDGGGPGNDVIGPAGTVVKTGTPGSPAGTVNRLRTQGAYLTYAYSLGRFWQFVLREDYFNPDRDRTGALANMEYDETLGINYLIRGNNAKIQVNYIDRAIKGPLSTTPGATDGAALDSTNLGASRYVVLTNFQQAF